MVLRLKQKTPLSRWIHHLFQCRQNQLFQSRNPLQRLILPQSLNHRHQLISLAVLPGELYLLLADLTSTIYQEAQDHQSQLLSCRREMSSQKVLLQGSGLIWMVWQANRRRILAAMLKLVVSSSLAVLLSLAARPNQSRLLPPRLPPSLLFLLLQFHLPIRLQLQPQHHQHLYLWSQISESRQVWV